MPLRQMARAVMLTGTVLLVADRGAAAQSADCTYDRCALRLQYRLFSTRVVQGYNGAPIATLGLFAPHIAVLESSPDTVRLHYQLFRRRRSTAAAFDLLGVAALGASAIVYQANYNNRGTATGLLVVGAGFSIVGSLYGLRSSDELERAIWFYNRSLPATR
jgi:hypothetical protein